MHFEVLVEDQSSGSALDIFLEKILGQNFTNHSWRVHSYKGIGRIPKNLDKSPDPSKRLLLSNLPRILRGYGRSLDQETSAVLVVLDSDDRDCVKFKQELLGVFFSINPKPVTQFRLAVEESEAWLLGDNTAVKSAYPRARNSILEKYTQDSVCGTWEILADATYTGGAARLKRLGWWAVGAAKYEWAKNIAPFVDIDANQSKSFQVFRGGILRLANI